MFQRSLFLCIVTTVVAAHSLADAPDADPASAVADDANNMLRTAAEAIAANYESLPPMELTFETVFIDPAVERTEKKAVASKNGVVLTYTASPMSISRSTVTMMSDVYLRSERRSRKGDEWSRKTTRVRTGDVWTFYSPASGFAQRKLTHQLGGFLPVDFPEVALR